LLDSPEIGLPHYDDTQLDAMLDLATRRGNMLRHNCRRRRSVSGALALALVAAVVGISMLRFDSPGASRAVRSTTPRVITTPNVIAVPSWKLVSDLNPPSWQEPSASGYAAGTDLTCPTATTCYLDDLTSGPEAYPFTGPFAPQVEVTHDGGASFEQSALPGGVVPSTALDCIDAETCAMFGRASDGSYVFVTTDDGGQTWSSLPGPQHFQYSSGDFNSLSCTTATSCVAVGSVEGSPPSVAAVTSNGGVSWSESEIAGDFSALRVQCVGGGNCISIGYDSTGSDQVGSDQTGSDPGPVGAVFYSSDGGSSWTSASMPTTGSASIGPVTSLSCSDASDCLASTFAGSGSLSSDVLVTTDGGETWTLPAAQGLQSSLLSSTSCATSSYCWASGSAIPPGSGNPIRLDSLQPLLTATDDQGASWTTAELSPSIGVKVVDAVSCPSAPTCFALGYESTEPGRTTGSFVFLSYDS
jgi:photosystem II stability/assembly factor-like uncharacterized protein